MPDIRGFKSGTYKNQYQYKSFSPNNINHEWVISDPQLNTLLSEADLRLGALDAFGKLIPDIDFFIKMHVAKEATLSSKIEGTQTTLGEAFLKKRDIDPEKRDDWMEVQNYVKAMNHAIKELRSLPLSNKLLRHTHAKLMEGVRGKHKQPGEFRTSQNWIGGASPTDAIFIPPHNDEVQGNMNDLEIFLNNDRIHIPHLIRIGMAHYQFETIHPFLDGNGRLGRLLITLYLVRYGILFKPTLYLSEFLEKNKTAYYDNLMRVRTHHDMIQWLRFFLIGVRETAERSIETFNRIIELREDIESKKIVDLGKKIPLARKLLEELYKKPVVYSSDVAELLDVNITTAHRIIDDFEQLTILKEITGFRRNRVFAFDGYLKIFER